MLKILCTSVLPVMGARAAESPFFDLMYGVVGDKKLNGYTFKDVLVAMGIPPENVEIVELKEAKDLGNFQVLIIPQGAEVADGSKIVEFVSNGGICWIMHQCGEELNLQIFPPALSSSGCKLRYVNISKSIGYKSMEYIGPWMIDKHHPIFHKPNYLDESYFVKWEIDIEDETHNTTAFEVITPTSGWDVICKFQDHTINDGALVTENRYNKGRYLWTQILSPQLVWKDKNSIAKNCWNLLLENLLTYFADLHEGKAAKIEMIVWPQTAKAGDNFLIEVMAKEPSKKLVEVNVEIEKPDGSKETINLPKWHQWENQFMIGYTPHPAYVPNQRGSFILKAVAKFDDGSIAQDHALFKVSKGWTPYRFVTHIHPGYKPIYEDAWPGNYASVGLLRGAAIRMGLDAIFLVDLPWGNYLPGLRKIMGGDDIDDGLCRFFCGAEFHYNAMPPEHDATTRHGGHHVCAYGVPNLPAHDVMGLFDPRDAETIWEQGGIIIAAHPASCDWYTRYDFDFDGVELRGHHSQGDNVETTSTSTEIWDAQLQKGKRITSLIGIDDSYPNLVKKLQWSIAWLDGPLTEHNLIQAIKEQRVISSHKIDYVWFDIGGVPVGGTVWAVDNVPIHFEVKGDVLIDQIEVISEGKVISKNLVKKNEAKYEEWLKVDADTYYRVEVQGEGWALTNPIWIKKIEGPDGCWYGATMSSLVETSWDNKIWKIKLEAPDKGKFIVHLPNRLNIKVNDTLFDYDWDETKKLAFINLLRGAHTISIEWQ